MIYDILFKVHYNDRLYSESVQTFYVVKPRKRRADKMSKNRQTSLYCAVNTFADLCGKKYSSIM